MLKQLLKNQFFIVGKKGMSFFAIFVMLILSAILVGASLSTNKNVGSLLVLFVVVLFLNMILLSQIKITNLIILRINFLQMSNNIFMILAIR